MEIRSPFPGMDPWLEKSWRDVHASLIAYTRDALNQVLPGKLVARMEERVFIETEDTAEGIAYPDVRVVEEPLSATRERGRQMSAGGGAAAEPLVIDIKMYQVVERYVQVLDAESGGNVVTSIEILSASNKRPGAGQKKYLRKQKRMRAGGVNLVEIDLLRGGQRITMANPERLPPSHRTPYQACVWRAARPSKLEVYRIPLRERLPTIRVPLRKRDADVALDLQALFDQAYRNGRYESTDYADDPKPPFTGEDKAWAEEIVRAAGML